MHCMRRGSHPPSPPFARGGKSAASGPLRKGGKVGGVWSFSPLAKGEHRGVLRVPPRCARGLASRRLMNGDRVLALPRPACWRIASGRSRRHVCRRRPSRSGVPSEGKSVAAKTQPGRQAVRHRKLDAPLRLVRHAVAARPRWVLCGSTILHVSGVSNLSTKLSGQGEKSPELSTVLKRLHSRRSPCRRSSDFRRSDRGSLLVSRSLRRRS